MMKADHRNLAVLTILVLLGASLLGTTIGRDSTPSQAIDGGGVATPLADLPGWFTENQGQITDGSIRFTYTGGGVAFRDNGIVYSVGESGNLTTITLTFPGANPVSPVGEGQLPHNTNYFIGNDPQEWRSGVRSFQRVVYKDLYDNIDLIYYITAEGLKFDWLVKPGGNPESIREHYANIVDLTLGKGGEMVISAESGSLEYGRPISYQDDKTVKVRYRLIGREIASYDVGYFDWQKPLIIDPLIYSTFIGGYLTDVGYDITVDKDGSVYFTGMIDSIALNLRDGQVYRNDLEGRSVFVGKLDPDGETLEFFTYIGGKIKGDDIGNGIFLDNDGYIFITGETASSDFPTTENAFDRVYNDYWDAFILKLSPDGQDIIYSTYVGSNGIDAGESIVVDDEGYAYVGGYANKEIKRYHDNNSTIYFPTTPGSFNVTDEYGQSDAFALKLSINGSTLIYSNVFSSDFIDFATDVALDSDRNLYVTGWTDSFNFTVTSNAFDTEYNGEIWDHITYTDYYGGEFDAFVLKLDPTGTELLYSTYIGGLYGDEAEAIIVDSEGNVYITGSTQSPNFPITSDSYDATINGGYDVFVVKLNQNGSDLIFSTFLGGFGMDLGEDLAIDAEGNVHLTGFADPSFPVTKGALDDTPNGWGDAFIAVLSDNGTRLEYSTYLGGDVLDSGNAITIDQHGFVYVTGETNQHPTYSEKPFPTTKGAFDTIPNGGDDIFVIKVEPVPGGWLVEDEGSIPAPGLLSVLTVMLVVVIIGRRRFRTMVLYPPRPTAPRTGRRPDRFCTTPLQRRH